MHRFRKIVRSQINFILHLLGDDLQIQFTMLFHMWQLSGWRLEFVRYGKRYMFNKMLKIWFKNVNKKQTLLLGPFQIFA